MPGNNQYYCSQKFWWLSIDLKEQLTHSCCSATPHKIDFEWLSHNRGQLFNTPTLLRERTDMLDNVKVSSCNECWNAEDQGTPSRRQLSESDKITHSSLESQPETINIVAGKDCNMTCSYCCKHYSSAWAREILDHGDYAVQSADDRMKLNARDKIKLQISQNETNLTKSQQLMSEIDLLLQGQTLKEISISGGEPFLNNSLIELLKRIPSHTLVRIYTGLGVSSARLTKYLDVIAAQSNIHLVISAENTGAYYEFNRYGNTWDRFVSNVDLIKSKNIHYEFNSVVSNLTVFGLKDFVDHFKDVKIKFSNCQAPDYLSVHVIDNESKQNIMSIIDQLPAEARDVLTGTIHASPSDAQISNTRSYVQEFAKRRNLDLNIFPTSFVNWINHVV
jgi:organic radical activating enzyme